MGTGLLDTLYSDCEGFIELRAFHPDKKRKDIKKLFASVKDHAAISLFVKQNRAYDLYFGVSTRDGKGGSKENIVHIPAVYVDIDFKDIPETEALKQLEAFPLQPTIIVRSGNGLHCYWKLVEPATIQDMKLIEDILWGLASTLKGDFASAEAARILRVPNTTNYKYRPPREVKLLHCNGSEYNPSDFDFLPSRDKTGYRPDTRKDSREALKRIMQCAFMQYCEANAKTLDEPKWYAMITQLAKEPGGVSMIHQLSKPHPKYSAKDTDAKILHALDSTGPMGCVTIREKAWDCGMDCGVVAPASLAFRLPASTYLNDTTDTKDTHDTCNTSDSDDTRRYKLDTNDDTNLIQTPQKAKPPILSDADKVREWLRMSDGVFHYTELARDLLISSSNIRNILSRFLKTNLIEKVGTKSGTYQKIDTTFERTELFKDTTGEFVLNLPLDLSDLVVLQPGNLVVVAGDTNAAKTAFLLETCRLNLHSSTIRYINSEMSDAELNNRLRRYAGKMDLDLWHRVQFGKLSGNFHHCILPDDVTMIDYIDIHQDFYRLGGIFLSIHEKLSNGLCIAAIQKRTGSPVGKGGDSTMEKCRLYLTLNRIDSTSMEPYMIARIAKCKHSRKDDLNANGLIRSFRVKNRATEFDMMDSWHRPNKEEQKLLFT